MPTFRPFEAVNNRHHRLPEAGRIRLGRQVPTRNGKTRPDKLTTLRFTSNDKSSLETIAGLYGGTVEPWNNEWETITKAPEVPIVLPVDDPLGGTPIYELWSRGGLERRCDGETASCPKRVSDDEVVYEEQPCLCNHRQVAECKVTLRLSVVLPEVPFGGVWRVETHSWNAAAEIPGMVAAVQAFASRAGFVRAFLGIRQEERMEAGRKKQFIVPYLRMDDSVAGILAGSAGLSAIPPVTHRELAPVVPPAGVPGRADDVDAKTAKWRLVEAFEAQGMNKDEARQHAAEIWADRGDTPISEIILDALLADCEIADAELIPDSERF